MLLSLGHIDWLKIILITEIINYKVGDKVFNNKKEALEYDKEFGMVILNKKINSFVNNHSPASDEIIGNIASFIELNRSRIYQFLDKILTEGEKYL